MKAGVPLAQPREKIISVIWIVPNTSKYQVSKDCSQFCLICEVCRELEISNHPREQPISIRHTQTHTHTKMKKKL